MKEVKTQAELDSMNGDWCFVKDGNFVAWGSSHVEARGSSHVEARGSSHIEAWGNSHVEACGSSHVVARGSSHVVARDNSRVEALGNSHVEAWGSSHVVARDFVSVVKYSEHVEINTGNMVSLIVPDYPSSVVGWCEMKGIKIENDEFHLWKTVQNNGTDFYSGEIQYITDQEIIAPDWQENYNGECGYGLHLSDSPSGAKGFAKSEDFRLLKVLARIADCRVFGDNPSYPMKLRARACRFAKEYSKDYTVFDEVKEG